MASTSPAPRTDPALFVDEQEAAARLALHSLGPGVVAFLFEEQVIPVYSHEGRPVVLAADLRRIERLLQQDRDRGAGDGLPGLELEGIPLGGGGVLEVPGSRPAEPKRTETAVLSPAIANLSRFGFDGASSEGRKVDYLCDTRIAGASDTLRTSVESQLARIDRAGTIEDAPAAQGTKFFGNKRRLAAFLVESLSYEAADGVPVLDLMTGSGAAAAAFSQHWRTWASDAQRSSIALAQIQGAGFSEGAAAELLPRLLAEAQTNSDRLTALVGPFVEAEARAFATRSWAEAAESYSDLVDAFPTLANRKAVGGWDPVEQVEQRRQDPSRTPYCLFLAYFANTYFGVRQALEIDNIRYGIEGLEDGTKRTWALGALIAAVGDLSTGFGGHFAQPRPPPRELSANQLKDLMSRRRLSIADEFDMRLRRLGRESERSERQVLPLPGPWAKTLEAFEEVAGGGEAIVYFDPPYRRDEYSRYYHALETLVEYGYPSAMGSGLIPDKKLGERFSSEFFSRSTETLVHTLAEIIGSVLRRGWVCCWSYSNQAAVSPARVIEEVLRDGEAQVHSFAAPHQHRGHGRSPSLRTVMEYLIAFHPR
jgi:adenine-specific DNA-methyltransferase